MRRIFLSAIALLLTALTITAQQPGCFGGPTSTGSETTFNMCGQNSTFSYSQWMTWQWNPGVSAFLSGAYGTVVGEPCANALSIPPSPNFYVGTGVDQSSEPYTAYKFVQLDTGYNSRPSGAYVNKTSSASQGCFKAQPSPIVLHLSGQGADLQLTTPYEGIDFNLTYLDAKSRIAAPKAGDAWLVRGTNAQDYRDLWGDQNEQAPAIGNESANGFRALRLHDNGDLVINAADPLWAELNAWFSATGEYRSLSSLGICGLSLNYQTIGKKDPSGSRYRYKALVYMCDGSTRVAIDVIPAGTTLAK